MHEEMLENIKRAYRSNGFDLDATIDNNGVMHVSGCKSIEPTNSNKATTHVCGTVMNDSKTKAVMYDSTANSKSSISQVDLIGASEKLSNDTQRVFMIDKAQLPCAPFQIGIPDIPIDPILKHITNRLFMKNNDLMKGEVTMAINPIIKAQFGYAEIMAIEEPNPGKVIIVKFADGSKTRAVCNDNDTFSFETGVMICIMKKILGDKNYHNLFKSIDRFVVDTKKEAKIAAENATKAKAKREKEIDRKRARQARRHEEDLAAIARLVADMIKNDK